MTETSRQEEYEKRIDERFRLNDRALELQAKEYDRRLDSLNHAHEKAVQVQHTYVTQDKYEDKLTSEAAAREYALDRVNEKFEDYVKRYEQRQREVDLLLQAQANSQEEAKRASEKAAQTAKDAAAETFRKSNRNIAIVGLLLTSIIVTMNLIGAI